MPPQTSNGSIFDDEDEKDFDGSDFDPDSDEFDDEPSTSASIQHLGVPDRSAPTEQAPPAPLAPPMTMAQIKAMMSTGASLARAADPFEAALARLAKQSAPGTQSRQAFSKKASWDAWGGQAKRAARSAAFSAGLRHEHEPDGPVADSRALATFCIDPGPLAPPGSAAALADPDLERLVAERLASALESAESRSGSYPALALMLCGWGARLPIAEAEARARGWTIESLD